MARPESALDLEADILRGGAPCPLSAKSERSVASRSQANLLQPISATRLMIEGCSRKRTQRVRRNCETWRSSHEARMCPDEAIRIYRRLRLRTSSVGKQDGRVIAKWHDCHAVADRTSLQRQFLIFGNFLMTAGDFRQISQQLDLFQSLETEDGGAKAP